MNENICVLFMPGVTTLTPPITTVVSVKSTLDLLAKIYNEVYVIHGNFPNDAITNERIKLFQVKMKPENINQLPMISRIFRFIKLQCEMARLVINLRNKYTIIFLAAGTQDAIIPTFCVKILRKKIILLHSGKSISDQPHYNRTYHGNPIYPKMLSIMESGVCTLADKIVVFLNESKSLEKYKDKVTFGGSRFYVDTELFKSKNDWHNRHFTIGFIGRLEEVKGILNFAQAVELLNVRALICGDGSLKSNVAELLNDKVNLAGWIDHNKLPEYLNEIKILVIPSYGEIGAHIAFEAMACGTIVLASKVGVMAEVIKDGINGFLLEDNSPECIVSNIDRILNFRGLELVKLKARQTIENDYTFEAAVNRYRKILGVAN